MCVLEGKNARQKLKNDNGPDLDRAQRYVIFRRPTLGVNAQILLQFYYKLFDYQTNREWTE